MSINEKQSFSTKRFIIGILALFGFAIMAYLTYIHYVEARSFCDISETVSCDVVTTSIYSEIFGLPVSLLGVAYFGLVLALMLFSKRAAVFQSVFLITLFVIVPSLYLSAMEFFAIKALCILCETSKLVMISILAISFSAARSHGARLTLRMAMPIVIAGLAATAITYFAQTGTVVKKDYSDLISCMNNQGVVYYKSFRCNSCKRQEKLLGDAYLKLNAVECHPDGPGGNPELCLAKNVTNTPTFILEQNSVEIKRIVGLQSIPALSDFSGCPLIDNQK